ncbi:MAG TPA: hypothetical protein VFL04_01790 [Rectinemataceae bacterium]|nr:hypothetical protein [Rectinemataceae bacterium]
MTPKSSVALSILCLAAALCPISVRAADLSVDTLDLVTHGGLNETTGHFEMSTRLFFDLSMRGGDKFAGLLRLEFQNSNVEKAISLGGNQAPSAPVAYDQNQLQQVIDKLNNLTSPTIRTAAVTAREAFDLPLDLTYFVGFLDTFGSGDDFGPLFGAPPFGTKLRGPMVYPNGVGGDPNLYYDGIAAANGTGFRLGTTPKLSDSMVAYLYMYQDSDIGSGYWSADGRILLNGDHLKFEIFTGASTFGGAKLGVYRGGFLFYAAPGEVGEFFAQVGVPHWDPTTSFSVDSLFFLFEPRVNFGAGNLALTVFYHPSWYRERDNSNPLSGEKGALDTAVNLGFGRLDQTGVLGGLEGLLEFRPLTTTPLTVLVSPYYSAISGGVEWDFKLGLKLFPLPSQWYGVLEPFIGLKTSF